MGSLAQRDVVAVLTRAPSAGGKSRLFAELGTPPDSSLLTALLLDTIDAVRVCGTPSGGPGDDVTLVVAVEPPSACDEVRGLVAHDVLVIPQPDGTLGERMGGVMGALLDRGARAVALIGSDLPTFQAAQLTRAFALLADDSQSVVIGPADDGGYYLIAARHVPDLFRNIEWGSRRVLDQTRTAAAVGGTRLHLVDSMRDVDTLSDLITCVGDGRTQTVDGLGRRTAEWARASGIAAGKRPMIKDGNNLEPRS
jgi:rSAM/selenodomain-associated transferase 1